MSTAINAKCVDCGAATEWYCNNNWRDAEVRSFANNPALPALIKAANEFHKAGDNPNGSWEVVLVHDWGTLKIDLKTFANCSEHAIHPYDEYGQFHDRFVRETTNGLSEKQHLYTKDSDGR